jgi:hypothetical protein
LRRLLEIAGAGREQISSLATPALELTPLEVYRQRM